MPARRDKKSKRLRGHKTHGWGSKKKHRGAGNRGGKGMAGTGKRADQKRPSIWQDEKYFGGHGFDSKSRTAISPITLRFIETNLDRMVAQGAAKKQGDAIVVDLSPLGYNKLLGSGQLTRKVHVKVETATQGAIDKVEAAGGKVEAEAAEAADKKATATEDPDE